jgi:hypothetical protein
LVFFGRLHPKLFLSSSGWFSSGSSADRLGGSRVGQRVSYAAGVADQNRCQCLHCKEIFRPNRHNWWHQKFCPKPECRLASKRASQRRWLSRPENQEVFRGSANVQRVKEWRAKHPGYWKRPAKATVALQDVVPLQAAEPKEVAKTTSPVPLQDFVSAQDPLVLGLIAHLVDSPLQDVVEQATRRLLEKGHFILDMRSRMQTKGNRDADQKAGAVSGAPP